MIERELPRSAWVPWLAKRIIAHHHVGGSCARCRPGGCDALRWARERVRAYRRAGIGSGRCQVQYGASRAHP